MSWLPMVVVAEVVLAGTLFALGADSATLALILALWALGALLSRTPRWKAPPVADAMAK